MSRSGKGITGAELQPWRVEGGRTGQDFTVLSAHPEMEGAAAGKTAGRQGPRHQGGRGHHWGGGLPACSSPSNGSN